MFERHARTHTHTCGRTGRHVGHPQVRMYQAAKAATKLPKNPDLAFCYAMLNDVSRRCGLCTHGQAQGGLHMHKCNCMARSSSKGDAGSYARS